MKRDLYALYFALPISDLIILRTVNALATEGSIFVQNSHESFKVDSMSRIGSYVI